MKQSVEVVVVVVAMKLIATYREPTEKAICVPLRKKKKKKKKKKKRTNNMQINT